MEKRIWDCSTGFKLIETFPREERFSLSNQITRASVSIPSNIAEGSRSSEKDYNRFKTLSWIFYELETHLLIAESVKYGDEGLRAKMLQDVAEEQKMLISFMNKLNK